MCTNLSSLKYYVLPLTSFFVFLLYLHMKLDKIESYIFSKTIRIPMVDCKYNKLKYTYIYYILVLFISILSKNMKSFGNFFLF